MYYIMRINIVLLFARRIVTQSELKSDKFKKKKMREQ